MTSERRVKRGDVNGGWMGWGGWVGGVGGLVGVEGWVDGERGT